MRMSAACRRQLRGLGPTAAVAADRAAQFAIINDNYRPSQ